MRREKERHRKKRLGKKKESPRRSLGGKQQGAEGQQLEEPSDSASQCSVSVPTPYRVRRQAGRSALLLTVLTSGPRLPSTERRALG